jgi:hypothetical protein
MTSVLELYRTNDHHRKIQTLLSKKDEETRINIIAKHGAWTGGIMISLNSMEKHRLDLRVDPFDTWCKRCLQERRRNKVPLWKQLRSWHICQPLGTTEVYGWPLGSWQHYIMAYLAFVMIFDSDLNHNFSHFFVIQVWGQFWGFQISPD